MINDIVNKLFDCNKTHKEIVRDIRTHYRYLLRKYPYADRYILKEMAHRNISERYHVLYKR